MIRSMIPVCALSFLIFLACNDSEVMKTEQSTDDLRLSAEGVWKIKLDSDCDTCSNPEMRIDLFRSGPDLMEAYISAPDGFTIGHFVGTFTNNKLRLIQVFEPSNMVEDTRDLSSRDTIEMRFVKDSTFGTIYIPNEFYSLSELNFDTSYLHDSISDGVDKLLGVGAGFEFKSSIETSTFSGVKSLTDTLLQENHFLAKQSSLLSLCDNVADAINTVLTLPGLNIVSAWYRPMGGCTIRWDGGGFFLNGYKGNGLLTYSIYVPDELTVCKTRQYNFHATTGKEWVGAKIIGEVLKLPNAANCVKLTTELLSHLSAAALKEILGSSTITQSLVEAAIIKTYNDFYEWSGGGFGISLIMNTHNNTVSIYVNVKNTSTASANHYKIVNHWLVKSLGKFGPKGASIYVGNDIKDHFHLKRNAIPTLFKGCTTPLFLLYILGTHEVVFD